MALNIGELVGLVRADDSGMQRGLSDAELRMRGFQRDTEGRLRRLDGRFATTGEQIALGLRQGTDAGERFSFSLGRIAGAAGGLLGVAGSVGRIAAMLGAAAPAAAGLVATLANIAPAGAVGVTAMLALKQATFAVKLGTQGMGDALKAALDPSKAEEFNEALKKLSPEAQTFALAVRDLGPAWKQLQQEVQDELFRGLGENLTRTAESVLPVLRRELFNTATALGDMAAGAMGAASELAENGTLGRAMGSASKGLSNLSGLPEVVVTALGQIAAAAGPSFERLSGMAADAGFRIGEKLSGAFESGRMQEAIETAIDLVGELAEVGANIGSILGSVFKAADVSGGGLIGTLQEVTGALADAFASPAVQDGLTSLFQTMATLAQTAAPLLGHALAAIAPVLTALGPPVQRLIEDLGAALGPVIEELSPILGAAAAAVGVLIDAARPFLPVLSDLLVIALRPLTPILIKLGEIFNELAPVFAGLAATADATLAPVLEGLGEIAVQLVTQFGDQLLALLPQVAAAAMALTPFMIQLGQSLGEILMELAPLLPQLMSLGLAFLSQILPPLVAVLPPLVQLASILLRLATGVITTVVIPALRIVAALLSGDFSDAWYLAKQAVTNAVGLIKNGAVRLGVVVAQGVATAVGYLRGMPGLANSALSALPGYLRSRASEAGRQLVSAIRQKGSEAIALVRSLPGRARSALGSLGGILASAGRSLIQGFINGIKDKIPSVRSVLGGITSSLPDLKGPEDVDKRILRPAGRLVIGGFMSGIADQTPALRAQLQGLTGEVPGMALGGLGGAPAAVAGGGVTVVRIELDGPEAVKRLIRKIVKDDGGGSVQAAFGDRRVA
ncbi:hypothetical protein ACFYO0_14630 [Streptomyces sp. NPDC006365]|uniref:phage tail protein n=1 Tax=Streptomyces sp. NPDC006365 TaxID=3364744 RepID=UPI00369A2451